MTSNKGTIFQWEIAEGKSMKAMQENNLIRHIHLLRPGWDDFNSPDEVIKKALNGYAQHKIVRYVGIEPKNKRQNNQD